MIKTEPKIKKRIVKIDSAIDVYDGKGKLVESLALPKEISNIKVKEKLLAQAVRVYLTNKRQGTVSTKGRGEVTGSTRKIYRQKGTGRARHGSIKAPIFVGGGVAFGPKPKKNNLSLNKKIKQQVLKMSIADKLKNHLLFIFSPSLSSPKTKKIIEFLKHLKFSFKNDKLEERTFMVIDKEENNLLKAGRNLKNLQISKVDNLNAYDILKSKKLLFTKDAFLKLINQKGIS